jgi:hypothetical protein
MGSLALFRTCVAQAGNNQFSAITVLKEADLASAVPDIL